MREDKAAWMEIYGDALAYNIGVVRSRLKENTKICAVIKGNAYGHGLIGVKKLLSAGKMSDMTAVGKVSEMQRVFRKTEDDGLDVLLIGMADDKEIECLLKKIGEKACHAVFSIYNMRQFEALNSLGIKLGKKIRVHIRVDVWDSGMGLGYDCFKESENELFEAEGIDVCGLYGHLYSAYSNDRKEIFKELQDFDELVNGISDEHRKAIIVHVLNSSLVFTFPEYSYDMVRVGTAMYGLSCGAEGLLKPAMKICTRIFDVREIDGAIPLNYQAADNKSGKRKIARAMIGYCDCPLLLTQNNVRIRIHDKVYPLADESCMDNLCIDVTGSDDVAVGDTGILLGENGVTEESILLRNHLDYVHGDWLTITAERLEKVYI
ncbi:alanine racemase [Butyrivibrio sp. AE3004]|uniref:alanine racemase n=1 Tax=Butyrivibrio sp. AE3004 TaxID=1506994 RepID=UPI00049428DF|nr:alanine racemase [Butyrivibrio sp. AE3004]